MFDLHVLPLRIEWCFQRSMQILCTRRRMRIQFLNSRQHAPTPAAERRRRSPGQTQCFPLVCWKQAMLKVASAMMKVNVWSSLVCNRSADGVNWNRFCASGHLGKNTELKTISRALAVFALAALNQCNFGVGTAAAPSLLGLADVVESVYTHSRTETCVRRANFCYFDLSGRRCQPRRTRIQPAAFIFYYISSAY